MLAEVRAIACDLWHISLGCINITEEEKLGLNTFHLKNDYYEILSQR